MFLCGPGLASACTGGQEFAPVNIFSIVWFSNISNRVFMGEVILWFLSYPSVNVHFVKWHFCKFKNGKMKLQLKNSKHWNPSFNLCFLAQLRYSSSVLFVIFSCGVTNSWFNPTCSTVPAEHSTLTKKTGNAIGFRSTATLQESRLTITSTTTCMRRKVNMVGYSLCI